MLKTISLILMGTAYILVGIIHFLNPKFFKSIMPPWVPFPSLTNIVVGIIEIALGALLFYPPLSNYAAWAIMALLIAVYPANIYHYQKAKKKGINTKPMLIRLPIQFLLLAWAWWHTF